MIIGRRIAALLVVTLAAAGCSTSVEGSPAPEGAAPAAAGSGGEGASVDACTLLKAEEVQDLIGAHQDAVVAEKRVRAVAPSESLLAAGRIVELERARREQARASLPRIWKRLERAAEKAF